MYFFTKSLTISAVFNNPSLTDDSIYLNNESKSVKLEILNPS